MAGRGQETGKAESKAEPFPPLTWSGRRQGQGHDAALGAVEDSDVRRRQRELQQVQRLVKAVHTNPNNGLFNVIGPSLGISGPTPRGYCILGLDGHVLGNADQKAPPPHDEGVRVINIGAGLACKVGQPDFDEVKYGLTGPGGEVYGAAYVPPTLRELVYPAHQPGSADQHPRSGQAKVIGRVALREPNTQQAARILVLGGQRRSRDDLIRWYCGVRNFTYGSERAALEAELDRLKQQREGSKDGGDREKQATGPASAPSSTPPKSLEDIEQQIRRMDENFHVIGTWYDAKRSAAFDVLVQDLARKKKELQDADKKEDNAGTGDEDAEARLAERKKQLAEEIAALGAEVAGFRHVQGQHAPLSRHTEAHHKLPQHTHDWRKLTHKAALALVYSGASGSSALNGFGPLSDFVRAASRAVKTFRPRTVQQQAVDSDFVHYVEGEVLLSVTDPNDSQAAPWPPENLIFINSPDIVKSGNGRDDAKDGSSEAVDLIEGQRQRLAPLMPKLLAAMRAADEDGSGHIDKQEFARAFEALRELDPPISKAELMKLFAYMDADGGGTVEMDDIEVIVGRK